jgi:hypothetical protein
MTIALVLVAVTVFPLGVTVGYFCGIASMPRVIARMSNREIGLLARRVRVRRFNDPPEDAEDGGEDLSKASTWSAHQVAPSMSDNKRCLCGLPIDDPSHGAAA